MGGCQLDRYGGSAGHICASDRAVDLQKPERFGSLSYSRSKWVVVGSRGTKVSVVQYSNATKLGVFELGCEEAVGFTRLPCTRVCDEVSPKGKDKQTSAKTGILVLYGSMFCKRERALDLGGLYPPRSVT